MPDPTDLSAAPDAIGAEKVCCRCAKAKVLDAFTKASPASQSKDGRHSWCKDCMLGYNRAWRKTAAGQKYLADTADRRSSVQREWELRRKYKISVDGFDAKLREQGGACAICRAETPGGRGTFHVDHDHACCPDETTCGACLRGLLCNTCNRILGLVNDDIERLQKTIDYVRVHRK
jgi:hypothetical protein